MPTTFAQMHFRRTTGCRDRFWRPGVARDVSLKPPQANGHGASRGFTLLEVTVATAMFAMLLMAAMQMMRAVMNHHRATERRATALMAIDAVAEQVANLPWDQLTTDGAKQVTVPPPLAVDLPGAKLSVAIADEATPVAAKRITVELTWNGSDGELRGPAHLTSWAFPDQTSSTGQ
jgi:prepilin-type N-terminal cleavage/methylation domain-containing protein